MEKLNIENGKSKIKKTFIVGIFIFCILNIPSCLTLSKSATGVTEEERQQLIANGYPIAIFDIRSGTPNSVGGVRAWIDWQNVSEKDIKYVTFNVIAYNRVNDIAPCTITRNAEAHLRYTGPYLPMHISNGLGFSNVWYNSTIDYMKIIGIEIIFMDDEIISFDEEQILNMIFE